MKALQRCLAKDRSDTGCSDDGKPEAPSVPADAGPRSPSAERGVDRDVFAQRRVMSDVLVAMLAQLAG
jgi:hypothetical protein